MKAHNVQQGSPEWKALRIGIPTASNFSKILTPRTGKASSQAPAYMCQLIAESLLEVPLDGDATDYMERGQQLEAEAVRYYEMARGMDTEAVGFCTLDDGSAGCSPDRLVGSDGGLEIKCPTPGVHVQYLLGLEAVTDRYRAQVQGGLWITGRRWWDTLSYHPEMQPALIRVERDEEFIAALERAVRAFNVNKAAALERLRQEAA